MRKIKKNRVISEERLYQWKELLRRYMAAKADLDAHIVENNRWFMNQHQNTLQREPETDMVQPASGLLFNALENKHADAMDAYPEIEVVEREEDSRAVAELLSKIIPYELEQNQFRKLYSRAWWYKLKHGATCYGVFFNPSKHNGRGDIDIKRLDLLNLYWAPGIEDIQDSPQLFLLNSMNRNEVEALYPHAKGAVPDHEYHLYRQNGMELDPDRVLVVDCYYKKRNAQGKTVVHLTKFCGNVVLDSTEQYEDTAETGLYDHGLYPVVMDVLYPIDGTPVGFGMLDIAKNPQCYIDKLDEVISKNALVAGKMRWLMKDNGGINENELLDLGQDIIHVAGSVSEDNIRQFQARTLDPYIITHRQNKITELKEITGNRDVRTGAAEGGVNGYNAILALQEAGSKTMRDMIGESDMALEQVVRMCIELFRQFFAVPRKFRVDNGKKRAFVEFSNEEMKLRNLQFDVKIRPKRPGDVDQAVQNNLALSMFQSGFFRPEHTDEALVALEVMELDQKERIASILSAQKERISDENPA